MLAMDDLGGLMYGARFPTVELVLERMESFRLNSLTRYNNVKRHTPNPKATTHPSHEWDALGAEAQRHAQVFDWERCLTVEARALYPSPAKASQNSLFQFVQKTKREGKRFYDTMTGKTKRDQQDRLIACYLLLQFWQNWDKDTMERAYCVYKDPLSRQLLVWFIKQEQQKSWMKTTLSCETSAITGSVVSQELSKISTWHQDW